MLQDTSSKIDATVFIEKFIKKENISEIWELAKSCRLNSIRNRLTAWRLFLGIFKLNESPSEWIQGLEKSRAEYQLVRSRCFIEDPYLLKKLQDSENIIKLKINIEHFKEILKIWLEVNHCEFKEEMIDILGVVVYVVSYEKYSDNSPGESHNILRVLNSPQHLHSDSYQIFSEIMKTGYLPLVHKAQNIKKQPEKTIIMLKCQRTYHYYIKSLDPELYNFLEMHSVPVEDYLA